MGRGGHTKGYLDGVKGLEVAAHRATVSPVQEEPPGLHHRSGLLAPFLQVLRYVLEPRERPDEVYKVEYLVLL